MSEIDVAQIQDVLGVSKKEIRVLKSNNSYDGSMDLECIPLCNAMNAVRGIITSESCCGHEKGPFSIIYQVESLKGLFFMARCLDRRYFEHGWDWKHEISASDAMYDGIMPTCFYMASTVFGEEAYKQAEDLVKNMNWHLNHPNFKKGYGFTIDDFETCKYKKEKQSEK